MDKELSEKLKEIMEQIGQLTDDDMSQASTDPVARMLMVTTLNECQKIRDWVDSIPERVAQRFIEDFIPQHGIEAIPAITLLQLTLNEQRGNEMALLDGDTTFVYKSEQGGLKSGLNYIPLFKTLLIKYNDIFIVTPHQLKHKGTCPLSIGMPQSNHLYVGISTDVEFEYMTGLSLLITGTNGVSPTNIAVGHDWYTLDYATMERLEDIEMVKPFDAQQSSGRFFSFIETWKQHLLDLNNHQLLFITDTINNRDLFKAKPYPKLFQQCLESSRLNEFSTNSVWLRIDFPDNYVVPDSCMVDINIVPVANVEVDNLMLTPSQPISKLQKQDNSFFLQVLEPSNNDEIIIRDFDAACYNNGDLYRDVRSLHNHFVDDYYAFIEYNGIKDGETLKSLRRLINKLGKSVGKDNHRFKFDSGTYVMRNITEEKASTMASTIKVSYITTQGKAGNTPREGDIMENRKFPAAKKEATVVINALCGKDKATVDERYELLRYYTLTADRLYTRMDIDAFLRKEIMAVFGKDEFKRIFVKTTIGGAPGTQKLQRGLYIDITFKDKKNYHQAVAQAFDVTTRQHIMHRSCISMPIIVNLINLEQ